MDNRFDFVTTEHNNNNTKENNNMTVKEYANEVATIMGNIIDDVTISVVDVTKNNGVNLVGLTVKRNDNPVAPTLYVDDFYNNNESVNACAKKLADTYKELDIPNVNGLVDDVNDFDKIKDKLIMCLANKELNKDTQFTMIPFLDLVITFKIALDIKEGMYIPVTDNLFKLWNVDAMDMLNVAKENTSKLLPYRYANIFEMLAGIPSEQTDYIPDIDYMPNVLTNSVGSYGAAAILYDGLLKKISKGKDIIIIPSSIHEVLVCLADESIGADGYATMIGDVNSTEVAPNEVLSTHAYKYIASEDRIVIL